MKENFYEPVDETYFFWWKFWLGGLFIWKLLSRDFSNIALWPASVISGYPVDIYNPNDYVQLTAIPPFFDLVTGHFVHWIVPFPSAYILGLVQTSAVIFAISFVCSPTRYSRLIGIIFYLHITYLWGFVYRLGQDIDAVFLLQGTLFIFCFLRFKGNKNYFREVRFSTLCIFVMYYFFSGFNKLIDLNYHQWFQFDIIEYNRMMVFAMNQDYYAYLPSLPENLETLKGLITIFGAAITYAVHLACPLLLLSSSTKKILFYWSFYSLFHFLTMYVTILFQMNFFAWLLVIPVYKLRQRYGLRTAPNEH